MNQFLLRALWNTQVKSLHCQDLRVMAFFYFIVIFCSTHLVIGREILKKTADHTSPLQLEEIQLDNGDAPQVKPIGCYKDQQGDRAFPVFYENMRGFAPSEIIMGCAKAAVANGYVYFGIQYGGECWGGKDGHLRFDMHGPADNCDKNIGSSWSNYVYKIEKVYGYCVTNSKIYKHDTLVDENNPCETCTCHVDGNVVCYHKKCPSLPSNCEKKVTPSGKCCPICACYHNNTWYKDGDRWTWSLGAGGCEDCYCSTDQAVCEIKLCPTCSQYVAQPGKCCSTCAEKPTIIIPTTTEEPVFTLPPWP